METFEYVECRDDVKTSYFVKVKGLDWKDFQNPWKRALGII